jgi:antitoxin CptB
VVAPLGRALYIRASFMSTDDARLKKLRFRAWRRGFREADLILGPFADQHVQDFSASELDAFERLLEVPDQDLYAWIVGTAPVPAAFDGEIMNRIKAFAAEAGAAHGAARGG